MERLSANAIAAAKGAYEPQRKNNFMLRVSPPNGSGEVIELSLRSFPFPSDSTEVLKIPYLNEKRKAPGVTEFAADGMELVLTDYCDQKTAEVLQGWRRMVHDPATGKTGLCKDIKVDATVILFAPDGSNERTWTLRGVWPSALKLGEGSMESSEANMITATLQCDTIKYGT